MNTIEVNSQPQLSDSQFKKIASFIQTNVGIKMPSEKKLMVQSRLCTRLKTLKIDDFDTYLDFVFSNTLEGEQEIALFINAITTNLTNFFRENHHFEFLSQKILPEFSLNGIRKIELWSAGCSTGQEPYSLAIEIEEFLRQNPGKIGDYSILATDISSKVLDKAFDAVYPITEIDNFNLETKKRYFLRSKDLSNPLVRIKPELRQKVNFNRLNFMDDIYPSTPPKHIIFCRNVLIYFDKKTQEKVLTKLIDYLSPGGYLFLGHSETIFGMNLPLKTVASTVYKKV